MKTLKTEPFGGRKLAVATPVNREQPKEEVDIFHQTREVVHDSIHERWLYSIFLNGYYKCSCSFNG